MTSLRGKLIIAEPFLGDKNFEEVIDFAAANEFACVELMCWPKGIAERRYAEIGRAHV